MILQQSALGAPRARIDMSRGSWALAPDVVLRNGASFSLVTILLTATHMLQQWDFAPAAIPTIRMMLLIVTGFIAYRTLMSGGDKVGLSALLDAPRGDVTRFAGVMLIILAPIVVLGLCLKIPALSAMLPPGGLIPFMMLMVVTYGALMILLGTALPATAARGDATLRSAIRRGRAGYREIGRAMVFGPWLFSVLYSLALLSTQALGLPAMVGPGDSGWMVAVWLIAQLLSSAGHVFAAAMTAVVLSRAYQKAVRLEPPRARLA